MKIKILWMGLFMVIMVNLNANTIYVNPGTDLVQQAVANASSGDVIIMTSGVHKITSSIIIDKQITLKGEGWNNTFLEKHNLNLERMAAIRIQMGVNGCELRDFDLRGRGTGGSGILVQSNQNILRYLKVHNCGSDEEKASGLLFHDSNSNDSREIMAYLNKKVGISHFNSKGNYLKNCEANNNDLEGLTIDCGSDNTKVENSTFNNNCNRNGLGGGGVGGVGIDQSNGAWLESCAINNSNENHGVTIQNNCGSTDGARIWNCTINNSGLNGIMLRNCTNPITNMGLQGNSFSGNLGVNIEWECGNPQQNNTLNLEDNNNISINQERVAIYPNPASQKVVFEMKGLGSFKGLVFYNINGQRLKPLIINNDNTNKPVFQIDVSSYPKGIYI